MLPGGSAGGPEAASASDEKKPLPGLAKAQGLMKVRVCVCVFFVCVMSRRCTYLCTCMHVCMYVYVLWVCACWNGSAILECVHIPFSRSNQNFANFI